MTKPSDRVSLRVEDYQYFMKELAKARDKTAQLKKRVAVLEHQNANLEKDLSGRVEQWDNFYSLLIQLNELLDLPLQNRQDEYPEE